MGRFFLSALAAAILVAVSPPAAAGERGLTVVELYSSQGCSSCPPADALLNELAEQPDILALSFHVDYWDYIGWRDPFALPGSTDRQRDYARAFKRSYVYTPQMVINGVLETSGRREDEVRVLLAAARPADAVPVSLSEAAGGGMTVRVGAGEAVEPADVWLVFFDRDHRTAIMSGENRGRTLRYRNVVRHMERLAEWSGEAIESAVPPGAMPGETCAVLVQARESGRILGAAKLADGGS